jgi:hypothetical protein
VSVRPDGTHRCDKCGGDVGNGSVDQATFISMVNPDNPSEPWRLHLCTAPRDGAPHGCTGNVLGPRTLAAFYETRTPPA